MQFLSIVGDGDLYMYILIGGVWARGHNYDFNYLSLCILLCCHWSNVLKQTLRDSRPQFDDPALAYEDLGLCSGEFGNPSGHALHGA